MASFFFINDRQARAATHAASEWAPSSTLRKEVRPPSLFARSQPLWKRWLTMSWNWLWDDADLAEHPRVLQGLSQIKTEFNAVVWDLQSYTASHVRESIAQARSLRELWHLRANLYRVIAVHRGQAEAERRLDSLNRHFPVRISSSQRTASPTQASRW